MESHNKHFSKATVSIVKHNDHKYVVQASVAEVQFSPVHPPFLENWEPNREVCAGPTNRTLNTNLLEKI